MRLSVKYASKKLKTEIRTACKFAITFLLSKTLLKNVSLVLEFRDREYLEGCLGYCEVMGKLRHPRRFKIVLDSSLSKNKLLCTLFHELTHVKQMVKNELINLHNGQTVYFGKRYDEDNEDYYFLPYEIEARGYEEGLFIKYLQYKKLQQKLQNS